MENSSLINEVDSKNAELIKFAKTMMQSKKAYDLTIDKLKKEKQAQEKQHEEALIALKQGVLGSEFKPNN